MREEQPLSSSEEVVEKLLVEDKALSNYLNAHKSSLSDMTPSFWVRNILLIVIGGISGIPFYQAAERCAAALQLPPGVLGFGTLINVGADGIWALIFVASVFSSYVPRITRSDIDKSQRRRQLIQRTLGVLLAITTTIAPVYAAFKYSSGLIRYLCFVTFFTNFCYKYIGFDYLMGLFTERNAHSRSRQNIINYLRDALHFGHHPNELGDLDAANVDNVRDKRSLARYLAGLKNYQSPIENIPRTRFFVMLLAQLVPLSTAIVDYFLTKEALSLVVSEPLAISVALLSAIADGMLNAKVVAFTTDRLLSIVYHSVKRADAFLYDKKHIPRLFFMLVSVTAPASGAYITYETLNHNHLPSVLLWMATSSIIVARIVFANFSLNNLYNDTLHILKPVTHGTVSEKRYYKHRRLLQFCLVNRADDLDKLICNHSDNNTHSKELSRCKERARS